jgi:hypothetical protein
MELGLPHYFGGLIQREFGLLRSKWVVAYGTTQRQQIIAIVMCSIMEVRNLWKLGLVSNPYDIGFPWLHYQVLRFHWVPECGSPGCTGNNAR